MRKTFLVFLILFTTSRLLAATFVVTSNADNGPGTLRQALLDAAANGSAEKDYINFNLPDLSEAGRTIALQSQLPNVSSNLTIDGTTQIGTPFTPSNAVIAITANRGAFTQPAYSGAALVLDQVQSTEIYGLYIYGFSYLNINIGSGAALNAGIIVNGSEGIQIGAPGKGNWISDCNYTIYGGSAGTYSSTVINSDLKIMSNYFGFESRQLSYSPDGLWIYGKNITLGGDNLNEGNHFSLGMTVNGDNINIIHNYMGVGLLGNPIGSIFGNIKSSGSTNVTIRNNICGFLYIDLSSVKGFSIYGNTETANPAISALPTINLYQCADGIVGSDDETQMNILPGSRNSGTGIANGTSKNIQILKNSISCVETAYFIGSDPLITPDIPLITVLVNNDTEYSGIATPNSSVYIYQDNTGCDYCNPVSFYTKVIADANGKWGITGSFANKKWVANALYNKNSSEFTQPHISSYYFDNSIINPTCGQANGSVKLNNLRNVLNVSWYDINDQKIGEGSQISNLGPGKYYAKCFNGNCFIKTPLFDLYDVKPLLFTNGLSITQPSCSQPNGVIKGLNVAPISNRPFSVKWTDLNNNIVGTNNDIDHLGPGSYLFTFTSDCSLTYGPIILKNATGPNIDQSPAIITPTNCGQTAGSITNITATGTGTLKYSWKNATGTQVATTKDLINQPGGVYTLQVTDDTQCGPVYSTAITIPELNGITLDDSQKVITQATCQFNNGSITNIKTTGVTIFKWYNSANPNVVVATTADLTNAPAGNYYLIASNAGNCSKQSVVYAITQQPTFVTAGISKILKNAACNQNNGRIEVLFLPVPPGTVVSTVSSFRWVNHATGQTIPGVTGPVLDNIDAGSYDIYGTNDAGCERFLITYSIGRTAGITINPAGVKIVNDACAAGSGSIKGITASGSSLLTYLWADASGKPVGNSADLQNVKAGSYTLTVTATDLNCSQTYGPVDVTNVVSVKIDESTAMIGSTNCGQKTGSVTNVTVTGTGLKYSWRNAIGTEVSQTKDLFNQPGGAYVLQVSDGTSCGTISSNAIIITEVNGITIDDSHMIPGQATCQYDNGSITNIKVPGATKYEWYNGDNKLVSTKLDLTGMPVNNYYLIASNDNNCQVRSGFYPITREASPITVGINSTLKNAACGLNNGSIQFSFRATPSITPKSYRWVNHATGATVGTTTAQALAGLDAGSYDIYYSTDNSGCERFLINYSIGRDPGLDVVAITAKVTDDVCESGTGNVAGIGVTGKAPLSYRWTDDNGKVAGIQLDLVNVKAGTYHLTITDGAGCNQDLSYTIKNTSISLNAPAVNPVALCAPGDALITLPSAPAGYGFKLYDNLTDAQAIDANNTGKFKIKATNSRSYFVSQYLGNCETARAEVKLTVGVAAVKLSNTFSPNGDGINDTWKIPGAENYPNVSVQIFTRAGDKVFDSIGYAVPFNGNYKGKPLPTGTYYYIINFNAGCSLLSGSLTIIR